MSMAAAVTGVVVLAWYSDHPRREPMLASACCYRKSGPKHFAIFGIRDAFVSDIYNAGAPPCRLQAVVGHHTLASVGVCRRQAEVPMHQRMPSA